MAARSDAIRAAAAAIANSRGNRRGAPDIVNVLEMLQANGLKHLYDEVMEDAEAALRAAVPAPFQDRVAPWMLACFGAEISADTEERNHRFLEEALELVQANGSSREQALDLVEYVYARPVGVPSQEVGGVMVTLAALCLASGIDMHAAAETELARVWTKVEAIRAKQASKPSFSALPGLPGAATEPLRFIYRNWRGDVAERAVRPLRIWFGSTEWHPKPQWLLRAIDLDKGAERDFAIGEIVGVAGSGAQLEAEGRADG